MKLWVVETIGLGKYYVVAEDATTAYNKVKQDLDDRDYGVYTKRQLHSLVLLADDTVVGDNDLKRLCL